MKTKGCVAVFLVFFLNFLIVYADPVSREMASKAASAFFASKKPCPASALNPVIESFHIKKSGETDLYYVFNFVGGGYVVISADDWFYPVLAWSSEGVLHENSLPANLENWLNWYVAQITEGLNNPGCCFGTMKQEWEKALSPPDFKEKPAINGVSPLTTSKWGQGEFYNAMCPADPGGFAGHVPVGCVATAMAQIMYYYRFPDKGNGSHSYIPPYNNGQYGVQAADFGNTWYHWDAMTDQCFESNPAIAQLCYHCGVSVNMAYQPASSGATIEDVLFSLVEYYNYAGSAVYADRLTYGTFEDWQNLLIQNLNNGQPLLYRSTNGWNGHAYLCDGYQDSVYFHFNWGWNGLYNGYYYINELIPGGINLSVGQGAVADIFPDTMNFQYPAFCSGLSVIAHISGSLEDGSGPENYKPLSGCEWLIKTENPGITNLVLEFTKMDTEAPYDLVSVFDGDTPASPRLGVFSGTTLPGKIYSSGPALYLTFTTNTINENPGWGALYFGYTLPFCQDLTVIDDLQGAVDDGSRFLEYTNNSACSWLIAPQALAGDSVGSVHLNFHFFDVAPGDTLSLYDGADQFSPLLGKYSGWSLPQDIVSSSGRVFLYFSTDDTIVAQGWNIIYWSLDPVYCHDTVTFTSPNGIIEDGSGDKDYIENTECYWLIDIPDAKNITFDFLLVDMEENYDNLKIFDFHNPLQYIARISGNEIPSPVVVYSDKVLLNFTSDGVNNFNGWKLNYTSTSSAVINQDNLSEIRVNPNPAGDYIKIESPPGFNGVVSYEVLNLRGEIVQRGYSAHEHTIIDLRELPPGVYLLQLISGSEFTIFKVIRN